MAVYNYCGSFEFGPSHPRGECYDAATGERVPDVCYYDTDTHLLGRLFRDAAGSFVRDPLRPGQALRTWETRPVVGPWDAADTPHVAGAG